MLKWYQSMVPINGTNQWYQSMVPLILQKPDFARGYRKKSAGIEEFILAMIPMLALAKRFLAKTSGAFSFLLIQ
jgi:hypothetical protein